MTDAEKNLERQRRKIAREKAAGFIRRLVTIPIERDTEHKAIVAEWVAEKRASMAPAKPTKEKKMSGRKIADKFNLTLGTMGRSDNRRLVQEPGSGYISKPFYVAQDGRIIEQFSLSRDRAEWLEEYAIQRGDR